MHNRTADRDCRLLSACAAAYDIAPNGTFTQRAPYYAAVGFTAPPTVVTGGLAGIDAALVGTNTDGVLVAFRGTLPPARTLPSVLDWIQDLLAAPEARAGFPGEVHRGFYAAWKNLEEGVVAAVRAQWSPGMGLNVTGHSKGGSLASLGAWALRSSGFMPTGVVSFAGAHVGDTTFAAAYDAAFTQLRYENHLDLVPFLPPTPALAGPLAKIPFVGKLFADDAGWDYAKVGRLRYITDGGSVIRDEPGLDALRVGEILAAAVENDGAAVVAAHSIPGAGGYCRGVCPGELCAASDPADANALADATA